MSKLCSCNNSRLELWLFCVTDIQGNINQWTILERRSLLVHLISSFVRVLVSSILSPIIWKERCKNCNSFLVISSEFHLAQECCEFSLTRDHFHPFNFRQIIYRIYAKRMSWKSPWRSSSGGMQSVQRFGDWWWGSVITYKTSKS